MTAGWSRCYGGLGALGQGPEVQSCFAKRQVNLGSISRVTLAKLLALIAVLEGLVFHICSTLAGVNPASLAGVVDGASDAHEDKE